MVRMLAPTIFGSVTLARDLRSNGEPLVALKTSSIPQWRRLQQASLPHHEDPRTECRILEWLALHHPGGHPNVQRRIEEFTTPGPEELLTLVTDYYPNGDLFKLVEQQQGLPSDTAQGLFRQLVTAVRHLHLCGVAHLDIKPENVLLARDGRLVLADFGAARLVAESRLDLEGKLVAPRSRPAPLTGQRGTVSHASLQLN